MSRRAMSSTVIAIEGKVTWRATQVAEGKRWVGICDALGIAMEADSLDELHSVLEETLHILLKDLLEDDELDGFLRERGWSAGAQLPHPSQAKDVEFRVPWEVIVQGDRARGSERRAH